MADAIYGGATIEATQNDMVRQLQSTMKGYQRQLSHDGVYAVVTLMANDDSQRENPGQEDGEEGTLEKTEQPRKCYIFCPERDRVRLFEELDHKTAAPLIPAFRDYVLASLQNRGDLRQLEVISQKERIDAWTLDLAPDDKNVIEVLEEGLKAGTIQIPGAVPGAPDGFDEVNNVTGYLNTFGVTVADRISSCLSSIQPGSRFRMKYSESMTISCKRPAIPSMTPSLRWRRLSSDSLTARKRRLSLRNAARTKRKSAQLPSAHCMAYGLHRKRTAEGSLSALSCTRLMSRKNGRERLGKRLC